MPTNRGNALSKGSKLQNGRYVIDGSLGEGAFGITYRAADTRLNRTVAIKELYPGGSQRRGNTVATPAGFTRERWQKAVLDFLREAQTIANLEHPSIVAVYDHFEENNTAYMVMRFINGMNLMQLAQQRGGRLPETDTLRYIAEVGEALSVLHQSGILHRDVKPSNVIVNRNGHAVLVDFGAAREFVTDLTQTHSVVLTPGFAPPEQFQPRARRGPTTDIYALAATCYNLLTGELPYLSDNGKLDNPQLTPQVRSALEHALAYNPAARPQTVADFLDELEGRAAASPPPANSISPAAPVPPAALKPPVTPDITAVEHQYHRNFMGDETIVGSSQPPGYILPPMYPLPADEYIITQPGRRGALLTIAGSLTAGVLLVVLAFLLLGGRGNIGDGGTATPIVAANTLTSLLAEATQTPVVIAIVPPTDTPLPTATPIPPSPTSVPTYTPVSTTTPLPPSPPSAPTDTPLRPSHPPVITQWKSIATLSGHSAAFSPDGSLIVTATGDNIAEVWDIYGNLMATLSGHTGPVNNAVFSADGSKIVTASGDGTARVWDTNGKLLATLSGHAGVVFRASFSPDGSKIVTASLDKTARIWDSSGKLLATLNGHNGAVTSAVFSPDGGKIVTASWDNTARIWDDSGKLLATLSGHTNYLTSAEFSADGTKIVTASGDGTARVWDSSGKLLTVLPDDFHQISSAVFSPDGSKIVTASDDKTARIWDSSGKLLTILSGHTDVVISATFSPDGSMVVTASGDGTARVWEISGKLLATLNGHTASVRSAAFSPDGSKIVTASEDRTARVWEMVP